MTFHPKPPICFECDECGIYVELDGYTGYRDFTEAWAHMKEERRWRCFPKHDDRGRKEWQHFCPNCVKAWWAEQKAKQAQEGRTALAQRRIEQRRVSLGTATGRTTLAGRATFGEVRRRRMARPYRDDDDTPPWED